MILWVYDRWGNQIGYVGYFIDFVHDDELGALDFIEFTNLGDFLNKGDYLVWRDEFGEWHEHIVRSVDVTHNMGAVCQHVYALNSISELTLSYINERNSYGLPNAAAWERLLQDTRWVTGRIDNLGTNDIKFYHTTVYEGITNLIKKWGGELSTTITVGTRGVTERRVNHLFRRGEDNQLLFTYGFDMQNVVRSVDLDDIYTKLHCFGKGEPTYGEDGEQTGYGRRLTFADINGGNDYLVNDEAFEKWGVIGKNGKQHAEGSFVFEQCEDKEELLELGKAKLKELSEPRITYTADVVTLANAGFQFKNARTGDTCYLRDKELDERLSGRIIHVRRHLNSSTPTEITLGNIVRNITDRFIEQQKQLDRLNQQQSAVDGMIDLSSVWLDAFIDGLNENMNVTGGYVYLEPGEGITVYDRPRDNDPTMAIQLKGAGFRIANSKKSNGEWDWRTFGTGDGFTADLINVGILRCGENIINLDSGTITFKDGLIQSLASYNYIDLKTGEFYLLEDDGTGIKYKDGVLTIDASHVYIGQENVETFVSSQIEVVENSITAAVSDVKGWTESQLEITSEAITSTVGNIKQEVDDTLGSFGEELDTLGTSLTQTKNDLQLEINGLASMVTACLCPTPAGTAAKVASLVDTTKTFVRSQGCLVAVTFTYTNTAANPTLNVAGTGNASIVGAGSTSVSTQMAWAAGSTVIFTWTGSAWQVADSSTQYFINTHFLFDNNGLTVMGSSSDYRSRVGNGFFSILNSANSELMRISASNVNDGIVTLSAANFGTIRLLSNDAYFSENSGGFDFSASGCRFGVNGIASVETYELVPPSTTASCSVNFGAVGLNVYTLDAVDIYFTGGYGYSSNSKSNNPESRVVRANFYGKSSACVDLLDVFRDGGNCYIENEKVTLTRSGGVITITRGTPIRTLIKPGAYPETNIATGTIFTINHVAICAR